SVPMPSSYPDSTVTFTLSLHDALPIWYKQNKLEELNSNSVDYNSLTKEQTNQLSGEPLSNSVDINYKRNSLYTLMISDTSNEYLDRKSTRLNSSHVKISYAVFCLKKKK